MIIRSVNLETVCGVTSRLPENDKPEIAFAGKSNVGKSSLINALMNRKAYARTSAQPGQTQTINFYNINDALYYGDLPGYGYAKVSQAEKEKWGRTAPHRLFPPAPTDIPSAAEWDMLPHLPEAAYLLLFPCPGIFLKQSMQTLRETVLVSLSRHVFLSAVSTLLPPWPAPDPR